MYTFSLSQSARSGLEVTYAAIIRAVKQYYATAYQVEKVHRNLVPQKTLLRRKPTRQGLRGLYTRSAFKPDEDRFIRHITY